MKIQRRELANYRIGQLTSLIDVIFLLLIFFMVTASFNAPESDLASALTASAEGSGAVSDLQPQIVRVELGSDQRVRYTLGANTFFDRDRLTSVLKGLPKEGGVFIHASDSVPWHGTAGALQACEDAGFQRVTYVPAD